jgi:hypothetical protein
VEGRALGAGRILRLDARAPGGETRRVEEAALVETLGHGADLRPREGKAVAAAHDVADLVERMLAVEEGDDVEEGHGEHRHLIGEPGRIPQPHRALPILLDRKRFERAEAGPLGRRHYPSRNFSAEAA